MEKNVDMEKFQSIVIEAVIITRHNASERIQEDSRSLREFLMLMQMDIMSLELPELQELQMKIGDVMKDTANQNKSVPVSKIETALETILDVLVTDWIPVGFQTAQ